MLNDSSKPFYDLEMRSFGLQLSAMKLLNQSIIYATKRFAETNPVVLATFTCIVLLIPLFPAD